MWDKMTFGQGQADARVLIQQGPHQRGTTARHPHNEHWTEKYFLFSRCVHGFALHKNRRNSIKRSVTGRPEKEGLTKIALHVLNH
jgi:hypothetical protein